MWHTILTNWRIKTIWSSHNMQKKILAKFSNNSWFKKKKSFRKWHRGSIPQHNEGRLQQTYCKHHILNKMLKVFPQRSERNKTRKSTPVIFIQYSFGNPQFSSVQLLSHVQLFETPWTAAHQASMSITNSQSLLKLLSIELVMLSNHLILCWKDVGNHSYGN